MKSNRFWLMVIVYKYRARSVTTMSHARVSAHTLIPTSNTRTRHAYTNTRMFVYTYIHSWKSGSLFPSGNWLLSFNHPLSEPPLISQVYAPSFVLKVFGSASASAREMRKTPIELTLRMRSSLIFSWENSLQNRGTLFSIDAHTVIIRNEVVLV